MPETTAGSSDTRDWIAYVGVFTFPEGSAASRRVLGVARSIAGCGYRVVVGAGQSPRLPGGATTPLGPGSDEISFCGVGEYDSSWNVRSKAAHVLWRSGRNTVDWLERQSVRPKAVLVYSPPAPMLARVMRWGRKTQVPVVADAVEWYSSKQIVGGRLAPPYWCNELSMRELLPRCAGIVGISNFLCRYYGGRGCRVLRIPPTIDPESFSYRLSNGGGRDRTELVYAGTPGRKDLLANVLAGLKMADPHGRRFRLNLVGPSEEQVGRLCRDYLRAAVRFHGRLGHERTLDVVRESDASVLIRPNERYANAGFPTKVVESLASGTPVIANLTSDLAEHLDDGVNGIVCEDATVESFAAALESLHSLTPQAAERMRKAARSTAERSFDWRRYTPEMRTFLDEVGA